MLIAGCKTGTLEVPVTIIEMKPSTELQVSRVIPKVSGDYCPSELKYVDKTALVDVCMIFSEDRSDPFVYMLSHRDGLIIYEPYEADFTEVMRMKAQFTEYMKSKKEDPTATYIICRTK